MKNALFLSFILWGQTLTAQTFTEIQDGLPFEQVEAGSNAFVDVDGDGDQDILLTGISLGLGIPITKLYINNGEGQFTEDVSALFEGVSFSAIAFADIDNDDDPDLLIAGRNSTNNSITKLYINSGSGLFEEHLTNSFEQLEFGSIAFEDVDLDDDLDLLLAGFNTSTEAVTKLYINDGTGGYTEDTTASFEGVLYGSVAFADVNGDDYSDLLVTGQGIPESYIAKLYIAEGNGSFIEVNDTIFKPVSGSSVAFADVDGDTDKDVFIVGGNHFYSNSLDAQLYLNDGLGNFSPQSSTSITGAGLGSIAIADTDLDGDIDILITGISNTGSPISTLYNNNGTGIYSEVTDTPFPGVSFSSSAMADIDGDGDPDVLLSGRDASGTPITKLYTNDGPLTSLEETTNEGMFDSHIYPNPSNPGHLQFKFNSAENRNIQVQIFNLTGQLIQQQQIFLLEGEQTYSLATPNLVAGNYQVIIDDGFKRTIRKLVVQ